MSKKRDRVFDELREAFGGFWGATAALRGRESRKPGEIGMAQYRLVKLLGQEGPLSAAQIAKLTGLSAATLSDMIDSLVSANLVTRCKSEEDKRATINALTEHGKECYEKKKELLKNKWSEALKDMSDEELEAAAAVLTRLTRVIETL
jgi:DNA-binding MarR family transcriptional regulator